MVFLLFYAFALSSEPRSSFSKDELEEDFNFYVASRSRYEHYSLKLCNEMNIFLCFSAVVDVID